MCYILTAFTRPCKVSTFWKISLFPKNIHNIILHDFVTSTCHEMSVFVLNYQGFEIAYVLKFKKIFTGRKLQISNPEIFKIEVFAQKVVVPFLREKKKQP